MATLHLYTLAYPTGKGESFIDAEIEYLSAAFEKVVILPMRTEPGQRPLPDNVSVHHLSIDEAERVSTFQKIKLVAPQLGKPSFLRDLRYQMGWAGQLVLRANALARALKDRTVDVHYSYWFSDWAAALSLLSQRGLISGYVSRAHGFDLFADRARIGFHPYHALQLHEASRVFSVSKTGRDYMKRQHPKSNKIRHHYLGTKDHGESSFERSDRLHILSCSSIIDLKRVNLIAEIFCQTAEQVDWTHIGSGTSFDIEAYVNPRIQGKDKKLRVLGQLEHDEVLDFMKHQHVDLLINMSSTEGIPVTMMEAISFGIPVLATRVGGVSELVQENTGKLVEPESINTAQLAEEISAWRENKMFTAAFRRGVRACWKEHFSAEKNYGLFCKELKRNHAL